MLLIGPLAFSTDPSSRRAVAIITTVSDMNSYRLTSGKVLPVRL
jgi:hypothetical protein